MDQVKIGRFLAQLRHEKNLTQEELGRRLGVTNKTISRWENADYMPDIETLQLISMEFSVSINELLCGERINDEDYRKKADENICAVIKGELFTVKEQRGFWKKKWLKEHILEIILCSLFFIAVTILLYFLLSVHRDLVIILAVLLFDILIIKRRNDMLGYIESHLYDAPKN